MNEESDGFKSSRVGGSVTPGTGVSVSRSAAICLPSAADVRSSSKALDRVLALMYGAVQWGIS